MDESTITLELPRSLAHALAAGHPWVYRDHVPVSHRAKPSGWARIKSGKWVGYALWDRGSPLALRVFSEAQVPDAAWLRQRVRAAWDLREPLRAAGTSAYRWIHGEGDGLPGVVVDQYGPHAVVATYAPSTELLLGPLPDALRHCSKLKSVVRRSSPDAAAGPLDLLWGRLPPRDVVVQQDGVRFRVDLYAGQKTGLFLDQRENRKCVAELARGRSVLDLFAYTGGFSLHAALGGASRVVSVDAAAAALAAARDNFELNGLGSDAYEFVAADVFEYLTRARAQQQNFGIVITDPPSFARSRVQLRAARKAYVRLGALAIGATEPGGYYVAASCTAQLSPDSFRETLSEAARRAQRRLQIIHEAGQPLDHPLMAGHPEGRYLKFMIGRVLPIP